METNLLTSKKGMTIAMVLLVIIIVLTIGMAATSISVYSMRNSGDARDDVQALYAAEAGLSRGIAYLKQDHTADGKDPDTDEWVYLNHSLESSESGYTVEIYNNFSDAVNPVNTYTEENITIPADSCLVISTGYVGSADNPQSATKVGVMLKKNQNPFQAFSYAAFGKEWVDIRGNIHFDAYDSEYVANNPDHPEYAVEDLNFAHPYLNPHSHVSGEANVGTNGPLDGSSGAAIELHGSSLSIDGDLWLGPAADLASDFTMRGHPNIGTVDVLPQEVPLPSVEIPDHLKTPQPLPTSYLNRGMMLAFDSTYKYNMIMDTSRGRGNRGGGNSGGGNSGGGSSGGGSSGSSSSITLEPGAYEAIDASAQKDYILHGGGFDADGNPIPGEYLFQGIDLSGGATIQVDPSQGPVIIYVDGNLDLRGRSGLNGNLFHEPNSVSKSATDCVIMATANCTSINMRGNPDSFTAIYAPDTPIWVHGNVDVFGSLVGKTIRFNGHSPLHYDVALRNMILPFDGEITIEQASYIRF
ncbi:MAG: pilus assembly PilX N-terminal domain-containing protein [Vulcanimicrobiota bacterium]